MQESTDPKKLGINCKGRVPENLEENIAEIIPVGIHLETFLKNFTPNDSGWINVGIAVLKETNHQGYKFKPVRI